MVFVTIAKLILVIRQYYRYDDLLFQNPDFFVMELEGHTGKWVE